MTTTAMTVAEWLAEARRLLGVVESRRLPAWTAMYNHINVLPTVVAEHDLAQREAWLEEVREAMIKVDAETPQ